MGTFICRIEMNKETGITIKVDNPDASIVQTIFMDGTAITTTVKGPTDTSTITQKQDSIAIKCKTYTLDAETITCKSTKDTKHESMQNFNIKSLQDTKLTASMNLEQKATLDAKMSGLNIEIKGSVSTKVSSGAMLEAKGQLTTLEGSITNIKGSLIKIG